jgi:hypothetical protein
MKPFVGGERKERWALAAVVIVGSVVMLAAVYEPRVYLLFYAFLAVGYVRGRVLRRRESRS